MASASAGAIFPGMYNIGRTMAAVRDSGPSYGPARDAFPAEPVLDDLPTAADADATARILARYAALRHWLLAARGAPAVQTDHAGSAAAAHLRALPASAERALLLALTRAAGAAGAGLRAGGGLPAAGPALLAAAAAEAERALEPAGAGALRAAAREAALRVAAERRRRP